MLRPQGLWPAVQGDDLERPAPAVRSGEGCVPWGTDPVWRHRAQTGWAPSRHESERRWPCLRSAASLAAVAPVAAPGHQPRPPRVPSSATSSQAILVPTALTLAGTTYEGTSPHRRPASASPSLSPPRLSGVPPRIVAAHRRRDGTRHDWRLPGVGNRRRLAPQVRSKPCVVQGSYPPPTVDLPRTPPAGRRVCRPCVGTLWDPQPWQSNGINPIVKQPEGRPQRARRRVNALRLIASRSRRCAPRPKRSTAPWPSSARRSIQSTGAGSVPTAVPTTTCARKRSTHATGAVASQRSQRRREN